MPPHAQTALWLLALLQTPVARADERPLPGAISREIMDSQVIVIGQFTNAQGDQTKGTTDLVVQEILKGDAVVAGKKTITVERYVADKEKKVYLAFGTVKQGMIEFHLGIASSPAFIDYVRGLLRIDVKDRTAVVKYCFDRLEDKDSEIAALSKNHGAGSSLRHPIRACGQWPESCRPKSFANGWDRKTSKGTVQIFTAVCWGSAATRAMWICCRSLSPSSGRKWAGTRKKPSSASFA
jgi:hypothetical protein